MAALMGMGGEGPRKKRDEDEDKNKDKSQDTDQDAYQHKLNGYNIIRGTSDRQNWDTEQDTGEDMSSNEGLSKMTRMVEREAEKAARTMGATSTQVTLSQHGVPPTTLTVVALSSDSVDRLNRMRRRLILGAMIPYLCAASMSVGVYLLGPFYLMWQLLGATGSEAALLNALTCVIAGPLTAGILKVLSDRHARSIQDKLDAEHDRLIELERQKLIQYAQLDRADIEWEWSNIERELKIEDKGGAR